MRSKNGFTLIELLVVIAIIALLLAIIIPSLKTVKQMAQGTVCMAHLRGMSMAFYLYAEDNDSKVAIANQGFDGQGSRRWVGRPQDNSGTNTNHNSTIAEKENGIMKGSLFPYVDTVKAYHCAGDRRYRVSIGGSGGNKGPYRSFAMPDTIGTLEEIPNGSGNWVPLEYTVTSDVTGAQYKIKAIIKYSNFKTPGDKYIFVEENYTHRSGTAGSNPPDAGYNGGVWSFWHQDAYEAWWDPLAPWHNDRTNLGYADGHGEKLVWKDKRTVWFANDRFDPRLPDPGLPVNKHNCATHRVPVNPDQQYMSRAFPRAQ